jgi:hypothetical protein
VWHLTPDPSPEERGVMQSENLERRQIIFYNKTHPLWHLTPDPSPEERGVMQSENLERRDKLGEESSRG